MTQGAGGGRGGSSLLRLSSIPPAARPSAERVRAMAASTRLAVQLLKKISQRPLMSVWEGQPEEGKRVALTVVDGGSTPAERARVLGAAEALMALPQDPAIQRVHRVSKETDAFVSDLWTTGSAADLSVLRWQTARKLEFGRKICKALVALHEGGIVHGCLCPDNVLLADDLGPVITEAQMVSIAESLDGDRENFFGYGAYAAPECAAGNRDPRGDVYSVGRLLAFLVLDREPSDDDFKDIGEHVPGLVPIVRRATLAKLAERHESMAELLKDLERCLRQFAPEESAAGRRTGPGNSAAIDAAIAGVSGGRRTGPGNSAAVEAAIAGVSGVTARRTGPQDPAKVAAAAAAAAERGAAPAPGAAPRPRNPTPGLALPATGPRKASDPEPIVGYGRWAAGGGAVLAASIAASYLMHSASSGLEDFILAIAAIAAGVVGASAPLRPKLRAALAVTAAVAIVAADPTGQVSGRGTLRALRSDDADMRAAAARALVADGLKQLPDAKMAGANLSGLDLSGANLEHADLTQANLAGTKLTSAKLDRAILLLTQLQGADLTGASLEGVMGLEAASCDQATVLPSGWHCDAAHGMVARGDPR